MTTPSIDSLEQGMARGACPALSQPMLTGDGYLVRLSLLETISPKALAGICRLAQIHGNGMLDISARGNLQVRGLTAASAIELDRDVRAMNLPLREGLAVEVPPLAGLDCSEIADPRPLAEAIAEGARTIGGLAPKVTVVIDGAGQLRLSDLIADIRLVAVSSGQWKLLLGGTERSGRVFNVLRETFAVDTVLDLLNQLATMGNRARGRDLAFGLPEDADAASALQQCPHPAASPLAVFALSNGMTAIGIGTAFGQARAADLIALCNEADRIGAGSLKPAPDHSLIFFAAEAACAALRDFADRHGFITSASDPRSHIAACTGSPACGSASIETHAIAAQAAAECSDLLDGSFKLHVAGCAKGCAHPQASAIALCGSHQGVSLIAQGKASAEAFAFIPFADTNATLCRLSALVKEERRPGENSARCLARIGSAQLAAAVTGRS